MHRPQKHNRSIDNYFRNNKATFSYALDNVLQSVIIFIGQYYALIWYYLSRTRPQSLLSIVCPHSINRKMTIHFLKHCSPIFTKTQKFFLRISGTFFKIHKPALTTNYQLYTTYNEPLTTRNEHFTPRRTMTKLLSLIAYDQLSTANY
jgi:hypothetical protein